MVFTAVQFYFLILLERGVTRKTFFNPKKAGVGSIRPSPVVFPKIFFLGRGCEVFFLRHLIISLVTFFLKMSMKLLKSFRKYEFLLTLFIHFWDFLTYSCYNETNDVTCNRWCQHFLLSTYYNFQQL